MKTSNLVLASMLVLFPVLSSCQSSSGHAQADSTAMHMDELRAAIGTAKEKIDDSAKSLGTVLEKADADPAPAFDHFKTSSSAADSAVKRAREQFASMKSQGEAYFAEWQKKADSMSDAELKQRAIERRTKLQTAVDNVAKAMTSLNEEVDAYLKSLKDMETYLSNDLTPAGIKSVKDRIKKSGDDAESINGKLDKVTAALEKGAPEFKTAKPPPPPAEPEKKK